MDSKVLLTTTKTSLILFSLNLFFITYVSLLNFISQGLIVSSRKESLQHFKQPWAHEYEPVKDLIGAVNVRNELFFKNLLILVFFFLISVFTLG